MKRVAPGVGIAIVAACGLLACLGSDPDPAANEKDSGGASTTDSGNTSATDGGGGSTDGGNTVLAGSVVERSDLEEAKCLGWTPNQASLEKDPRKHGGESSCRVCASPDITSVWGMFQVAKPSLPKGTYTVNAFVHADVNPGGPAQITIRANLVNNDGSDLAEAKEVESNLNVAPNDVEWQSKPFDIVVPVDGITIAVAALVADPLKGCFLVDDFTVTRKN